jgi:hypothetical protein
LVLVRYPQAALEPLLVEHCSDLSLGELRPVTPVTQMQQYHDVQIGVNQSAYQAGGSSVRKVSARTGNPSSDVGWIRSLVQHFLIVVCLDHQAVTILQQLFESPGGTPDIARQAELQAARAVSNRQGDGLERVVIGVTSRNLEVGYRGWLVDRQRNPIEDAVSSRECRHGTLRPEDSAS